MSGPNDPFDPLAEVPEEIQREIDKSRTPTGEQPVARKDLTKALNLNEVKTVVAIVIASVGVLFGAWRIVLSEARAQAMDAGAVLTQKQGATQAELERFQHETDRRFERLENQGGRTEKKLDAMLDKWNIPNPAPAPVDGGR